VQSLHQELNVAEPLVDVVLKKRLSDTSFKVKTLSDEQFQQANSLALLESGSIYDPAVGSYVPLDLRVYAASIKKILVQQYQFDTLVLAKLLLRDAEIVDNHVEFDGVRRDLEYGANTPKHIVPRRVRGLALQLDAFTGDNNATRAVFGGISLPYYIKLQNNQPDFVIKENFFSKKEVEEAAKIAVKKLQQQLKYEKHL
jgi:hypothetical protein